MNSGFLIVFLAIVSLSGVSLRAQQASYDYDNFGDTYGASAFASSVVYNNGGFLQSESLTLPGPNNNANKNPNRNPPSNPAKPKGHGQGANKANPMYANNPFLQSATTPKPPPHPRPAQRPAPAGQGNKKPAKKPAKPAVAPTPNNKKKNNGGKGKGKDKKRVSDIKYEQYVASIFPDAGNDGPSVTNFNGRELARPGEFPHMGAIGFRNTVLKKTEYKCGASLISNIFVVTSAHCTEFNGLKPSYVRFGDLNLRAAEEDVDPQTRQIARIINHPYYSASSLYNDIALLQLEKPVIFTEFVRPIRLWYRDEIPFTHAFAMGFGAVQFAGAATNRLTEFNLTIISNDICGQQLPKQPNAPQGIIESQICAIDLRKKGTDTFQGDSGGPLQVSYQGRRRLHNFLIGVTSFGVLGVQRYPGVYTRISSYVDWIEQNVWSSDYYAQ